MATEDKALAPIRWLAALFGRELRLAEVAPPEGIEAPSASDAAVLMRELADVVDRLAACADGGTTEEEAELFEVEYRELERALRLARMKVQAAAATAKTKTGGDANADRVTTQRATSLISTPRPVLAGRSATNEPSPKRANA